MEINEEDDISVVSVQDSDGVDDLKFPNFNIRLLPSMTGAADSEIKQAHTALNTAYGSIKSKLSKVEQENKELKMLLNRKKLSEQPPPSVCGGTRSSLERNGEVGKHTSHSEILRHKRSGLAEESQHKRHGSWAYFNDNPGDQGSYVQFIEMQTENIEKEKQRLQEELEQLRVRYTDNELQITKLKQESAKQDTTIQQLRVTLQEKDAESRRQQSENEELRKMNMTLQHQLKKSGESYDRVCTTNKTLEDRLQHHVDVQTRKRTPDNPESLRLLVTNMMEPTNKETVQDADLLSSLHQSVSHIQEQNQQLSALRQLAQQQQAALKQLWAKFGATATQEIQDGGRPQNISMTMQHPITCEDDLEKMLSGNLMNLSDNKAEGGRGINTPSPYKGTETNDPLESSVGLTRHKLRFPSQNSDDFNYAGDARRSTPPLEEVPWAPVKGGGGGGGAPVNTHNPFLTADIPGEIRSDGVFDDLEGAEMPTTMATNYSESEDFTIHNSGESQTQVKHRLPSTNLENNIHYDNQGNHRTKPPPLSSSTSLHQQKVYKPDWSSHYQASSNQMPQQQHQAIVSNIAYPPTTTATSHIASPLSINDRPSKGRQLTEIKVRPQIRNQGEQKNPVRLPKQQQQKSQSETIGRVTGPPPVGLGGARQRQSSTEILNPLPDSNREHRDNGHSQRCTQNTGHNNRSQQETATPPHHQRQPSGEYVNTTSNLPGVNLQRNPLNPFRNDTNNMTSSPRPLNNMEQNQLHDNGFHHPNSNISGKLQRDVNINPEQPIDKLPGGCSGVQPGPLNNDPLLNTELGAPKPVSHHNLSNTYLTVKLPPVENAEQQPPPSQHQRHRSPNQNLSGDRPEAQTCPVCTHLYPTTTDALQEEFERHVNDCLPENDVRRRASEEIQERQCIMCEQRFPVSQQSVYEAHVQSHFGEEVQEPNFEVLQMV